MGHARGVIYLAARQLGVPVLALAPSEVKRAMTGNGAAGKGQMQRGRADRARARRSAAPVARGRRPRPRRDRHGARDGPAADGPRAGPGPTVIASLRGRLRAKLEDRVILEAAGVGYEVFLPPVTQRALAGARPDDGDGAARSCSRSTITPPRTSRGRC